MRWSETAQDLRTRLTEDEYLAVERRAELRSEFYDGEMFATKGASRKHDRIVSNLVITLGNQLRDRDCNVYSSDMRVRVPATGLYTYPDAAVTCGEEEFADDGFDTLLNPLVVIEVLSDPTEAYDRGRKFEHYQSGESLLTYVLVSQESTRVEKYERRDGGAWLYTEAHEEGAMFEVPAIRCSMKLEDVYAKV